MSEPICTGQPRAFAACKKAVISDFITTSPTNVRGSMRDTSIGIASPSFMPMGVAFTTKSNPAGSLEALLIFSAGQC